MRTSRSSAFSRVGAKALDETAKLLEINDGPLKDLRHDLPFAAYGQGQIVITPFKMARVAATIAAGGRMPQGRWVTGAGNARQDAPREVVPAEAAHSWRARCARW